ncbi:MAG: EF-P lysine aminoacylase EpmA [Myxococcota bacterium]|nr:EF-P lysine aminoacylase EpmA [Myxococcota bacterium]
MRLGARVVAADGGRWRLADATGSLEARAACEGALPHAVAGAWVLVEGRRTTGGIVVERAQLLSRPSRDFPTPDSDWSWLHDGDGRRARWLLARAALLRAIRAFLDARGYVEVDTPLAVRCPGTEVHIEPPAVQGLAPASFLVPSPEYSMKRLLSAGLPRIYQLGHCFRAGERGALHEPEFTMLEWYRGFASLDDMMDETEALVAHVATALCGRPCIEGRDGPIDLRPPWARCTVASAFERHAGVAWDDVRDDEDRFWRLYVERVEPALGRDRPQWLTGWPASMASLARLDPDDPAVALRAEAYVAGIELCNAYDELRDPTEQRARLLRDLERRRSMGRTELPVDERFLSALADGLPPCAGNALGVDRLLLLLVGASRIADVVPFAAERL